MRQAYPSDLTDAQRAVIEPRQRNADTPYMPAKQACKGYPSIERFCTDAGYRGTFTLDASRTLGRGVDISEKIKPHEWEKLPWRWIVERTLAWFYHSRRLNKDYEILAASAEVVSMISHAHTLLNRF